MYRKTNLIFTVILISSMVNACKTGEEKSDLDKCFEVCAKTYEECGDELMENSDLDDDDLSTLLDDCQKKCSGAADNAATWEIYEDCIFKELGGSCQDLWRDEATKSEAYSDCRFSCQMELDCADLSNQDDMTCLKNCKNFADELEDAEDEFFAKCDDAWDDAQNNCENLEPEHALDNDQDETQCSPDCPNDWLANGVCEEECNIEKCHYDMGDCEDLAGANNAITITLAREASSTKD